jgi:Flp pilus assembly pilin Flp
MQKIHTTLSYLADQRGQTMTETAVLMALIVVVVMASILLFGSSLGALWAQLSSTLPNG